MSMVADPDGSLLDVSQQVSLVRPLPQGEGQLVTPVRCFVAPRAGSAIARLSRERSHALGPARCASVTIQPTSLAPRRVE